MTVKYYKLFTVLTIFITPPHVQHVRVGLIKSFLPLITYVLYLDKKKVATTQPAPAACLLLARNSKFPLVQGECRTHSISCPVIPIQINTRGLWNALPSLRISPDSFSCLLFIEQVLLMQGVDSAVPYSSNIFFYYYLHNLLFYLPMSARRVLIDRYIIYLYSLSGILLLFFFNSCHYFSCFQTNLMCIYSLTYSKDI